MAGSPPCSTLFPYTTLFRSVHRRPVGEGGGDVHALGRERQVERLGGGAHGEDRKSTRLNSSHVESSYAVFCLKTKWPRVSASGREVLPEDQASYRAAHASRM